MRAEKTFKQFRVWNDNELLHREKFKGKIIEIPAGESIDMQKDEAVEFKSQFFPQKVTEGGEHLPEGFKMIRLEPLYDNVEDTTKKDIKDDHTCMKCNFTAVTAAGLASHIRHNHVDSMVDEDARDKLLEGD